MLQGAVDAFDATDSTPELAVARQMLLKDRTDR
jgi:hypothetical protein